MLVWDNGTSVDPYWHDVRTHKVDTAIALAKSAKFLVSTQRWEMYALVRNSRGFVISIVRWSCTRGYIMIIIGR